MFDIYARSLFNATRLGPFTRPLPQTERDIRLREGDRAGRDREERALSRRLNYWI